MYRTVVPIATSYFNMKSMLSLLLLLILSLSLLLLSSMYDKTIFLLAYGVYIFLRINKCKKYQCYVFLQRLRNNKAIKIDLFYCSDVSKTLQKVKHVFYI